MKRVLEGYIAAGVGFAGASIGATSSLDFVNSRASRIRAKAHRHGRLQRSSRRRLRRGRRFCIPIKHHGTRVPTRSCRHAEQHRHQQRLLLLGQPL